MREVRLTVGVICWSGRMALAHGDLPESETQRYFVNVLVAMVRRCGK